MGIFSRGILAGFFSATVAFAALPAQAGGAWRTGDLGDGALTFISTVGNSYWAYFDCHIRDNAADLVLRLSARNHKPGALIGAQVLLDNKPFQFTSKSLAFDAPSNSETFIGRMCQHLSLLV